MTTERLIKVARDAVGELRDAVRVGRVIEFRQRDELVIVLFDALDRLEALLAAQGPQK